MRTSRKNVVGRPVCMTEGNSFGEWLLLLLKHILFKCTMYNTCMFIVAVEMACATWIHNSQRYYEFHWTHTITVKAHTHTYDTKKKPRIFLISKKYFFKSSFKGCFACFLIFFWTKHVFVMHNFHRILNFTSSKNLRASFDDIFSLEDVFYTMARTRFTSRRFFAICST